MGDRIDNRVGSCRANRSETTDSTERTQSDSELNETREASASGEVRNASGRQANEQLRGMTGMSSRLDDGFDQSFGWKQVQRHLQNLESLEPLSERGIGRAAGFDGLGAVALRDLLSDTTKFETHIERTLMDAHGHRAARSDISDATRQILDHAETAFGDRVSQVIGERVRKRLRGAAAAPSLINESRETRRAFMATLASRSDGDEQTIRAALAKLNVEGERADRIVRAVQYAVNHGEVDALSEPSQSGPDVITGWSDGLYVNAAQDLAAGIEETIGAIDGLRRQLGHRDMATPASANLVNPNVSATRSEVLAQLDIGDLTDDQVSAEGGDAERALMSYRDELVSDNQWTEKLGGLFETVTFGVADYFSGGAASGGAAGMELFVAWHEANMADFAERRLGTADPGTGAAAWRELGEMATDEAVEVVAGQLLDGLPTPSESPTHVDMALEEVKQRAADRIGDVGSNYVGGEVSGLAGETNVSP